MSRLFLSVARPKHVLLALAAAFALLFAVMLLPSRAAPVSASSSTCDPPHPHAAGTFPDETFTPSGGTERTYRLHVPSSYDGGQATPLLFNFHGFTSNPFDQDIYSQLPQTAEAEGFILVTPQGTLNDQGQAFWNSSQNPPPAPDDVGFVDQLLTSLQSQLCIDPARVFSTGISNGGFMSSRLACVLSDRIAAVAPVAGTTFPGSCDPRPVPVIAFHGTNDLLVSLGPIENTAIPGWASHNACTGPTEQDPLAGTAGVRLVRYDGCDDGATVELYVVFDADLVTPGEQGGGHSWPGTTIVLPPPWDAILGLASPEISANELMWDFFLAHPLPDAAKPVGGISLGGELAALTLEMSDASGRSYGVLAPSIAVAAAVVLLAGIGWYATRRLR